jgi:NCS1 family nucleobase:cation symporter-1
VAADANELGDRPWRIERNGINPVPDSDRHASTSDLFWVWFAANLAIVGLVLGAVGMSYGLSLWQGVLVLCGVGSFALIGYFAIPGTRTGVPTMVLSRATFGTRGNVLPSVVSWLNLVGWETVVLVVATLALESAARAAFGVRAGLPTTVAALLVVMGVAFSVALLGHATLVRVQTVFSYVFGGMTVVVAAFLLPRVDFARLVAIPNGPWITGVLPAWSVVVAGTGLSWVNAAADYTRYLPRRTAGRRIWSATTFGSVIPALALMLLGVLLYGGHAGLATTANPIGYLQALLPVWLAVPYLLTAVASMVTGDILDIYSSGLSLLAAEVKIPRYKTVLVDAVLSVGGSLYVLLAARANFMGTFEAFLSLLAGVLAPWAGVFVVDLATRLRDGVAVAELYRGRESRYGAYRASALAAWGAGLVVAGLFTSTPVFSGPLATGVFQGSDLGFVAAFVASMAVYGLWPRGRGAQVGSLVSAAGDEARL